MALTVKGAWDEAECASYLRESSYPLRLGCIGEDGFPRVISVWYRYVEGAEGELHCVSHRSSQLVAILERCDKVGFEVSPNEPPYSGVRGQAVVEMMRDGGGEMLESLLERYLGGHDSGLAQWLLSRSEDEILIRIKPRRLFSWDYRERMSAT